MEKINLCSVGDPKNQKLWSGTPFRIYSELLRSSNLGIIINASIDEKYKKILQVIFFIKHGTLHGFDRSKIMRYYVSSKVKAIISKSKYRNTLHTGTLSLPFKKKANDQNHFLFCDSTWNLLSLNSKELIGYSNKMYEEAEKLEKLSYDQMMHIFPISNYVKQNLIEHYKINPGKISVVGTGLGNIKPFYGEKYYDNYKILFVAKDRFLDKGGELVLSAFQLALKKNHKLELTIVGQNDYVNKISHPKINALGFISNDKLQQLFNTHSVFLMPAFNEPWGLVYLEAMACKMPIIGLNRNSFPELSRNGEFGFGIDSPNADLLASKIIEAFNCPDKLKEMGEKAQEYVISNYSWVKTVSTMIKIIEEKNNE